MYALVEIKGKQYKAEKGKKITVDLCDVADGEKMEFPVLFLANGDETKIGTPHLSGAKVTATAMGNFRDKKVEVYKYNRRKGYRKARGHRQSYTTLLVNEIVG